MNLPYFPFKSLRLHEENVKNISSVVIGKFTGYSSLFNKGSRSDHAQTPHSR